MVIGQLRMNLNPVLLHEIIQKYIRIGQVPEHYRFAQFMKIKDLNIARLRERAGLN